MTIYALKDFAILRPQYETLQTDGIAWLVEAHAKLKSAEGTNDSTHAENIEELEKQFNRVGCKPEHINRRGHELPDFLHTNWSEMQIFRLDEAARGSGLAERQQFHQQMTDAVFEKFYPQNSLPPEHLIHVSCTGYCSPSSAQKVVAKRLWGDHTQVTHAYHMGCYASIPAIRMAKAYVHQHRGKADIVHTELCTLHFNPANHQSDQIVLQSLFADGYIKYSVVDEEAAKQGNTPYFIIEGTQEQLLPECAEAMTWMLKDWGFEGTLSKEIPVLIAKNTKKFIENFAEKMNIDSTEIFQNALFAVHPGGPKILDYIQKILNLNAAQLDFSRQILLEYGNISSATLPHIWQKMAQEKIRDGTRVMSLAFGPGLNIAGTLLTYRAG